MVWLCNPNNPTGTVIPKGELLLRIAAHPDVVFVMDQSYEAFCREPLLSVQEAATYGNLLLLHSMTKQYALPGLRLGYLTGAEKLVGKVECRLQPWSVNVLAQLAGKFILCKRREERGVRRENSIEWSLDAYMEETQRLWTAVRGIDGMEALPTSTNFFLVRLEKPLARSLKQWLAEEGILIRDASNFEGLDGHYIRIAAQRPEENDLLIEKLKEWSMR
jgi:threonine-phosphate decarboxylase